MLVGDHGMINVVICQMRGKWNTNQAFLQGGEGELSSFAEEQWAILTFTLAL